MLKKNFDPNAAATLDSGIFGLPFTAQEAQLVLIPVPWEATTSYGGGTASAPQAILAASKQVDLFDIDFGNFFHAGIAMIDESIEVQTWNRTAKLAASAVIAQEISDARLQTYLAEVNHYGVKLNDYVYEQTKFFLAQGKQVGIVGGDHATPLGAIKALLEKYPRMGILHFDAHADMRKAFEGFEYSHASIMYNVITQTNLSRLVQVGIRDFCEEEFNFINHHADKIITFFDARLAEQKLSGKNWALICADIIENLPQEVYISFDIDGLDPRFCPHTGTPVPGGLDFHEALFLLKKIVQSGRKIIGFDLNEVSIGVTSSISHDTDTAAEWDANVGARLLYQLCGLTITSHS